jgi:hypothetical protein
VSHEHAHPNPNTHDDPSAAPLLDVATIATIVFVATVLVVAAMYFQVDTVAEEGRYQDSYVAKQLAIAQDGELLAIGWMDKANGVTRIAIDDAIDIVTRDLAAGGTGLPPITTVPPIETSTETPASNEEH